MNIAESRIATYNWGAAYLVNDELNVVVDKGSRMNKAELINTAKSLGLAIVKTITSVNTFGFKVYKYETKAVA